MTSRSDGSSQSSLLDDKPTHPQTIITFSTYGTFSQAGNPVKYIPARQGSTVQLDPQADAPLPEICSLNENPFSDPFYAVEKLEDQDDAGYVTTWRRKLHQMLPLTTFAALATYLLYFVFRIIVTVDSQRAEHNFFPVAWIFIAIETGMTFPVYLFQLVQCFSVRKRQRPRLRVVGSCVPQVDVLVTCAGEDVTVILDTVKAAADLDWPRDRLRVVVLDDKASMKVWREVQLLALNNSSIHYTARKKVAGVPHHFKAGNLNHGLSYVDSLEGCKAEYIAALDADMITFYNVPKNDCLYQNQVFFFGTLESAKDAMGSAWCTGSGYAIRRSALDQIGGFSVDSVAEDVLTSSLLTAAGWKTCYLKEVLQCGTVPDSYSGHLKQRTRWTIGYCQTSAKLNFFLFGRVCRKLTFLQRFCGFAFALVALTTVSTTGSLLLYPILLFSGRRFVVYANTNQLRWLIRFAFLSYSANRLNEWTAYVKSGYRFAWPYVLSVLWMAPLHTALNLDHASAIIRCFILPHWLGGRIPNFSSSGSITSTLAERDAQARAPLFRRLRVICWNGGALLHLLFVLLTLAAAVLSILRTFTIDNDYRLLYILTHAGWPPATWLVAIAACTTPIEYAINPPTTPDREKLMQRELGTGIAHPREEAKRPRGGKNEEDAIGRFCGLW
ncbi:MAG: hypothetical protein Q9200_006398 [Gallowayella weberi]